MVEDGTIQVRLARARATGHTEAAPAVPRGRLERKVRNVAVAAAAWQFSRVKPRWGIFIPSFD